MRTLAAALALTTFAACTMTSAHRHSTMVAGGAIAAGGALAAIAGASVPYDDHASFDRELRTGYLAITSAIMLAGLAAVFVAAGADVDGPPID